MKRISILFFIAGFLLCGSGIYLILTNDESPNKEIFDYSITDKEKEYINSYLSNKYNNTFEIISRDSRYCLIQKEDSISNIEIDSNCDKKEIINDIFRVKDKDGIEFYVKNVTLDENLTLLPNLINSQSSGFYDNYMVYYLTNKYSSNLLEKFDFLTDIESQEIYYGLGIEDTTDLINNKNMNVYQSLGRDSQNAFNKNYSYDSFLIKANELGFSFDIGFYIKTNMDITPDNFQSIVKAFVDNDCYNLNDGIKGNNIIIEFNNKRYLNIHNGYLATLYEYEKNVFEKDSKRLYNDSILLNNDSFSEEGITLSKFLGKRTSSFEF